MADLPLLKDLPPITQRRARRELASAILQLSSDLRALNGHLDPASREIMVAVELGHTKGKPMTEAMLHRATAIERKTVRRRLEWLITLGEVMQVRFKYKNHPRPYVVYVLDPEAANEPRRVRRVRDAIKTHASEMKLALDAMDKLEDDDSLPILPANGDDPPVKLAKVAR